MRLKETISKNISNQISTLHIVENNEVGRAAFTHFLQHRKNDVAKFFKKEAVKYAEALTETENIVAESPLEYQIFNYNEKQRKQT